MHCVRRRSEDALVVHVQRGGGHLGPRGERPRVPDAAGGVATGRGHV